MLTFEFSSHVMETPDDAYTTLSQNLDWRPTPSQEFRWLIVANYEMDNHLKSLKYLPWLIRKMSK